MKYRSFSQFAKNFVKSIPFRINAKNAFGSFLIFARKICVIRVFGQFSFSLMLFRCERCSMLTGLLFFVSNEHGAQHPGVLRLLIYEQNICSDLKIERLRKK